MTQTILVSVTAFVLMVGVWTANLVCYQPAPVDSVNPLAPINMNVAWK
jgi:hypothetical protein